MLSLTALFKKSSSSPKLSGVLPAVLPPEIESSIGLSMSFEEPARLWASGAVSVVSVELAEVVDRTRLFFFWCFFFRAPPLGVSREMLVPSFLLADLVLVLSPAGSTADP